jgi:hypothetical protein
MGWIGCVSSEKLLHDFATQTFALISPFQPVLHQVWCNNETIPNARKHYETHQNIGSRSNGMNRVCSLRIIPPRLLGTNYCIICTSSERFAPISCIWIGCIRCEKLRHDFLAQTTALIAPVQPVLHQVLWSNETIPNAPKHYKTHQNLSLRYIGVNRVRSLWKTPTQLRYTNLCINFTISTCFAPSLMQQWNDLKCTQTLQNTPKQRFKVQWDESGAFVAYNSATTSWRKLLHYMHQFSLFCTMFHAYGLGAFVVKNYDTTSWHKLLH